MDASRLSNPGRSRKPPVEETTTAAVALLGRAREIAHLRRAIDAARAGSGVVALVAGDPGIGKTRLAAEVAAMAAEAGMRVAWGRCREEGGAPAHWPWVQILRALARECDPAHLAAAAGTRSGLIAAAVPEIDDRLPRSKRETTAPVPTQFAFFDAVETFLRLLATREPLALVLDDLHAADPSSLGLLDFIVPELERSRIMVIATYREHEASSNQAGPVIARAARHGVRIHLVGLDRDHVGALATASADRAISPELVDAIHRTTEGNPLFVQEIVRTLSLQGSLVGDFAPGSIRLADSIEHVLASRLEPLGPEVRKLLSAAAVIGRDFDVSTLQAVTEVGAKDILTELQTAIDAGIVVLRGGVRGHASFSHALYRELFFTASTAAQRLELHARVAAALERRNAEEHLSEIAFHLLEAGPIVGAERTAGYARRAGEQALARLAFAQAVLHFEDALRAHEAAPHDGRKRCEVLLRLADAHFRAGAGEASKEAFKQAAAAARKLGEADLLAIAALGLAAPWPINGGVPREDVVSLLEQSLTAVGEGNPALRATILARLAVEHIFDPAANQRFGEEAVAIAQRSADPHALVEAHLACHYTTLAFSGLETRHAELREAARLARELGDDELLFRVHFQIIHVLFESGNRAPLDREVAAAARLAERLRQPFYFWFVSAWRAGVALADGRLDAAEGLIEEALASGRAVQGVEEAEQFAAQTYGNQMWNLRLEQGRGLDDFELIFRAAAETVATPVLRSALILLHSAMGRMGEARDELETFAADDFAVLPADWTRIPAIAFAADACADLGATDHARRLYDLARPYARHHMSNGSYYFGSMHHRLARLAAACGDIAGARARFDAALKAHRQMGARCWIARTQAHQAELLLRHGDATERAHAFRFAREALNRASEIGMTTLEAFAERLVEEAQDAAARVVAAGSRPEREAGRGVASRQVLRPEGGVFRVEWGGRAFHLRHHRGLVFLARLLAQPGTELLALALVSEHAEPRSVRPLAMDLSTRASLGDAGALLDARARSEYRRRLADLEHEIDVAEEHNDAGRASRLRDEKERLAQELARAVGLGGRARRAGSHAERARINVSRAISETVTRIAQHSPELAQHLRETVRTGTFCSYRPDSRIPVRWET